LLLRIGRIELHSGGDKRKGFIRRDSHVLWRPHNARWCFDFGNHFRRRNADVDDGDNVVEGVRGNSDDSVDEDNLAIISRNSELRRSNEREQRQGHECDGEPSDWTKHAHEYPPTSLFVLP
jgi:hypothetical protein